MGFASTPPVLWSTDQVAAFLESLSLAHVIPAFRQNGVTGDDLVTFTESDFEKELGLTNLQTRKVMKHLSELQHAAAAANSISSTAPHKGYPDTNTSVYPCVGAGGPVGPPAGEKSMGYPGMAYPAGAHPAPHPAAMTYTSAPGTMHPQGYPSTQAAQPVPAGYPVAASQAAVAAGAAVGVPVGPSPQVLRENRLKAINLLSSAHSHLQQGAQLLHSAKSLAGGMAMADVITVRRRPFMGNLANLGTAHAEQEKVEEAEVLVKRACVDIEKAQRICPQIPAIDQSAVLHLKNGFVGIIFVSGLAQAMRAGKIGEMERSVQNMSIQVQSAKKWLSNQP